MSLVGTSMKIKVILKMSDGTTDERIISKSSFTLGRSSQNDLCVKSEGLSREHCRFEITSEGDIYITDLNSTNGVLFDGTRIETDKPVKYLPFFNLIIGPIHGLEILPLEGVETNRMIQPISKSKEDDQESANNKWQLNAKKSQSSLWLGALIVLLSFCILYLFLRGTFSEENSLPNSPKTLTF